MRPEHDPVERNRAAHPRRTPGRSPTGWHVTSKLLKATAATLVLATGVLVSVLAFGG
jgi:hypothetical protein